MGIRGKIFTTITLIALAAISFVYFRPPSDFYTEAAIVSFLNKQQPQFAAKEIVDIVYLDDKHVFIPFISKQDEAGLLMFAWRSGEWKHVETSVNFEKYYGNSIHKIHRQHILFGITHLMRKLNYRLKSSAPIN